MWTELDEVISGPLFHRLHQTQFYRHFFIIFSDAFTAVKQNNSSKSLLDVEVLISFILSLNECWINHKFSIFFAHNFHQQKLWSLNCFRSCLIYVPLFFSKISFLILLYYKPHLGKYVHRYLCCLVFFFNECLAFCFMIQPFLKLWMRCELCFWWVFWL